MRRGRRREEAAIARTPKAADETPKPRRAAPKTAAGATTTARKAPAKPKTAAKPRAAAAAKPKAAPKAEARPKTPAARAAARTTAKPAAKPATPRGAAAKAPSARPAKPPATPRPTRAKSSPRQKVEPALLDRLVAAAARSLEDDKAENLVVLDVTGRADYADRLVVATGLADRQIQAMATHLEEAFAKEGLKLRRDAIQGSPDWVLIDCGDLVVHLFKPEARALYALERMWGPDSPGATADRTPLPDDGSGGSTATEEDEE